MSQAEFEGARKGGRCPDLVKIMRLSPEAALGELRTSRDGVTPSEASALQRKYGRNELPRARGPSLARKLLGELFQFFALMLWVAAALSFLTGSPQLGVAIIIVIVFNALFSFIQEYQAERATRALSSLLPQRTVVVRGGQHVMIAAEEVVPGDVLVLREGNRISSDARVVSAEGLHVDNSILTGESVPVQRDAEAPASDDVMGARNVVFAGTFVTSGFGRAVTVATGQKTQLSKLSSLTGSVVRRPSPLRIDINRTVRVIAACAVGTGLAFFAVGYALHTPLRDCLLFAVGVIVALVPNGLLPTVTVALSMGAKRMAHRRALVRHLESVETLGSTTVICSDKTGTMTANQMTVQAVIMPGERFTVSGVGFSTRGSLLRDGRPLSSAELEPLATLLKVAALCGNATVERREGRWICVGDPVEGALLVLATKGGLSLEAVERSEPRVHELPFEANRRRMSTVQRLSSGHYEVLTKGSPEAILPVCSTVRDGTETVPLDEKRRTEILEAVDSLAREGLRVLALAHRTSAVPLTSVKTAEAELEFLGLVGLADPVHPQVPDAVRHCHAAGIRVLMLTGDHPATARSVANIVGLPPGPVVLGTDLPNDDKALQALLAGPVSVFARIVPEQKLQIARALQRMGEVVAMTGDGVNDAPALRQADIGVAMGAAGTDVAREASDMVLLDDNFATIVDAVEEGRAVFDNVGRFLTYDLTVNVAELLPFLVWALSGGAIPLMLSVLQILGLDVGASLFPALALGAEPAQAETMTHPPRPRSARSLNKRVLGRSFGYLGPIEAVLSLAMLPVGAALFFGWHVGSPLHFAKPELSVLSTLVFSSVVLMQMVCSFECRSTPASVFQMPFFGNPLLPRAVGIALVLLAAFVNVPGLRDILGMRPLTFWQWMLVCVPAVLFLGAEELRKAIVRLVIGRRAHEASGRGEVGIHQRRSFA